MLAVISRDDLVYDRKGGAKMTITKSCGLVTLAVAFSLFLSACSAHSPFIITNTTDSSLVGTTSFAPNQGRVFVTEQTLPPEIEFTLIGTIDVGKIWYGASKNALDSMADKARELGANAIIQARTWHQPSGFSLSAPHGSGKAVWIKDISALSSSGVTGEWY